MVRKESADTHSTSRTSRRAWTWDEDELNFMPSVVGRSAGWHESRNQCDGRCLEEGFKCWEIAAEMAEENGELCTINLCKGWYNLWRDGKK